MTRNVCSSCCLPSPWGRLILFEYVQCFHYGQISIILRHRRTQKSPRQLTKMSLSRSGSFKCRNDYCSSRSSRPNDYCSSSSSSSSRCSSNSSSTSSSSSSGSRISRSCTNLALLSREPTSNDSKDIDEDMSKQHTVCSTKPNPKYKTSHQMIKEKLGRIKEQMKKTSTEHLCRRPERKPYHPFVWNSLSPYRDTYEIDYLIAMSSSSRQGDETPMTQKSPEA
ncbi:protein AF-9-like [Clupea harengus]|uniref:Protein AF-9-like n=1 Tax=Clupea harengus TaxID=7950 RepID=A0A8M1KQT0_CLUHA|nr:protein AF-9-like [Clupea harengus]